MAEELQEIQEERRGGKLFEVPKYPLSRTLGFGVTTLVGMGLIDVAAHLGPTGLVVGLIATYVVGKHGPEVLESLTDKLSEVPTKRPVLQPPASTEKKRAGRTVIDRALGRFPEEIQQERQVPEDEYTPMDDFLWEDEEDILVVPKKPTSSLFSQVLSTFTPSLDAIFIGFLQDGTAVYSTAKGLCHVALAGSTGQGKTTLIRLIASQLCKAGASVLLLNPHYTSYDLEAEEDWTPFEPYLVYDPMECRKYDVIEHYLKHIATEMLPRRLEKYAHSRPVGKPYFIVIDELPAIVRKVPDATEYLETILREGRKVGIFLITAAQDFLVKTIAPQGSGAVRDCFRTAMYVGGDPTTAKVLLDMKASDVPEDQLGKGTIMLRCSQVKQSALAHVPYVDNKALYRLLGPSTYRPEEDEDEEDTLDRLIPSAEPPARPTPQVREQVASYSRSYAHPTRRLSPELERAYQAYKPGMSFRQLAEALGDVNKDTAGKYIKQLREHRLID